VFSIERLPLHSERNPFNRQIPNAGNARNTAGREIRHDRLAFAPRDVRGLLGRQGEISAD
jgi:hypothetical protein